MFTGFLNDEDYLKEPDKSKGKHMYYKAICGRRVLNIQEQLRLMRNLSNRNNYEYTKEDIDKLEEELNMQLKFTIMALKEKAK